MTSNIILKEIWPRRFHADLRKPKLMLVKKFCRWKLTMRSYFQRQNPHSLLNAKCLCWHCLGAFIPISRLFGARRYSSSYAKRNMDTNQPQNPWTTICPFCKMYYGNVCADLVTVDNTCLIFFLFTWGKPYNKEPQINTT